MVNIFVNFKIKVEIEFKKYCRSTILEEFNSKKYQVMFSLKESDQILKVSITEKIKTITAHFRQQTTNKMTFLKLCMIITHGVKYSTLLKNMMSFNSTKKEAEQTT